MKSYSGLLTCLGFVWITTWLFEYLMRHQGGVGTGIHLGAVVSFILDLVVVTGGVGCIGLALTGRFTGIAINGLNQYSLSRAQMTAWTIVVVAALSSFLRIRLTAYLGPVTDPSSITIPGELLAAMGISAFSTVAAPAVLALKANQTPDPGELQNARGRTETNGTWKGALKASGRTLVRDRTASAVWSDMVLGDELANAGDVDISKVQQMLITVLLLGAYLFAVVNALATGYCVPTAGQACPADMLDSLPTLSESFIGLLALSHAGYLAYKVAPKPDPNTGGPSTPGDPAETVGPTGDTGTTGAEPRRGCAAPAPVDR